MDRHTDVGKSKKRGRSHHGLLNRLIIHRLKRSLCEPLHGEFWMTKASKNPRPRCRTHSASRRFLAIQSCQNTLRVFPGKPLSPEEASQQGCLRTWNPKKSDALSKHRPILPIPCPAAGHEWFEISKRSRPSRCALASPGLVQLVDAHSKYVQMMMSYGWSKFKRPQEF